MPAPYWSTANGSSRAWRSRRNTAAETVTSVESLAGEDGLHPLHWAFIEHDGFQCGYCTPGQICSAAAMAAEVKRRLPSHVTANLGAERIALTADELRERMSGNLCRCGAHNGIVARVEPGP